MPALFDIKKLQELLQRTPQEKKYPKHLLIELFPLNSAEENKVSDFQKLLQILEQVIDIQTEHSIPILTVSLGTMQDIDQNQMIKFSEEFLKKAIDRKTNVTIFGRWYDLKGMLVESLKLLNNETKDFDACFLNLCINYDGKQEIADASRLMVKKALLEKLDPETITVESLKENIYTSFFIPPDLIITHSPKLKGTFLWDSVGSLLHVASKPLLDITKQDIMKSLEWYSQQQK